MRIPNYSIDTTPGMFLHFPPIFVNVSIYPFLHPSPLFLQARRKITNKSALDDITDRTGVAIISRGAYAPPGKKLEPNERRLHLLIEGSSEMSVKQARLEIQKVLEDETIRISNAGSLATSGRYSVL